MTEENHERKSDETIIRLAADFEDFTKRYDRERRDDKEARESWRDEIKRDLQALRDAVDPVIKDHDLIIRGGKWVVGAVVALWGLFKGWFIIKDHFH